MPFCLPSHNLINLPIPLFESTQFAKRATAAAAGNVNLFKCSSQQKTEFYVKLRRAGIGWQGYQMWKYSTYQKVKVFNLPESESIQPTRKWKYLKPKLECSEKFKSVTGQKYIQTVNNHFKDRMNWLEWTLSDISAVNTITLLWAKHNSGNIFIYFSPALIWMERVCSSIYQSLNAWMKDHLGSQPGLRPWKVINSGSSTYLLLYGPTRQPP